MGNPLFLSLFLLFLNFSSSSFSSSLLLPLCAPRDVVKALLFCLCRGFSNLSVPLLLEAPIHRLCLCFNTNSHAASHSAHTINPHTHQGTEKTQPDMLNSN